MIDKYLESLHGKVHKMLYIFEENEADLHIYAKNLAIEIIGATITFPDLKTEKHYIDILNIVNFFAENTCNHNTCYKQVLKCHDLIDRIWTEEFDEEV